MSRTIQALAAFALFIGVGFVTRHYYREWMQTAIKKATEESAKETAKWKSVKTNYSEIKIEPLKLTPRVNLPRPSKGRSKS